MNEQGDITTHATRMDLKKMMNYLDNLMAINIKNYMKWINFRKF